ncbi:uncharacterized protein BYT42DRAFT_582377 [Radiomyces spectabilis]|uniref:uncharacterized protein n=1 Tax=Radiomyces spectabilis TaxID=64574 RepID=UPI0022205B8E|nr:uncharacterized protein BYT42DRAFT_582377 [Radiomyces spectabilis]KAI8370431.1 hypothetical protein BYT42DRAFT_582377 [Radiomyces spectabilis]
MLASERISRILPTVKCSDCGEDVHIRRLSDHICSNLPPLPSFPLFPHVSTKDKFDPIMTNSISQMSSSQYYDSLRKNSTSPAPPASHFPQQPSIQRQDPAQQSVEPSHDISSSPSPHQDKELDTLMADIMKSLSAEDLTPTFGQEPTCNVCNELVDSKEEVIAKDDKHYHPACFNCHLCRAALDVQQACFFHNGKLYCERDYQVVKKRDVCAACDRPITAGTTPIKALGKLYHPGHLKCHHCSEPVSHRGFKEHQGNVFCRHDYRKLYLPPCRACQQPLNSQVISAVDGSLQGKWHVECFGCHTCHQPFPGNTFYVFDNAPYCKRHYHQLNNSLCRSCDEPIEGACAQTAEGWRFHPSCFDATQS